MKTNETAFLKWLKVKMPHLFINGRLCQPLPKKALELKDAWDSALLSNETAQLKSLN